MRNVHRENCESLAEKCKSVGVPGVLEIEKKHFLVATRLMC